MKKVITILITFSLALSLCGCGMVYTDKEIREIYNEGFSEGYSIGLDEGAVEGCSHLSDFFIHDTEFRSAIDNISLAYDYLDEMRYKESYSEEELSDVLRLLRDAINELSNTEESVIAYLP